MKLLLPLFLLISFYTSLAQSVSTQSSHNDAHINNLKTDQNGVRGATKSEETNTFTDQRDNKTYKTVKIGVLTWMAENLAYLPKLSSRKANFYDAPAYYVLNFKGKNVLKAKETENYLNYGVLYNYTAAKTACPAGWHLSTDEEWKYLEKFLDKQDANSKEQRGINIVAKLKSSKGWNSEENGTNESGFSAFPSGIRRDDGTFNEYCGSWWSFLENGRFALFRSLCEDKNNANSGGQSAAYGRSVRCVKDYADTTVSKIQESLNTSDYKHKLDTSIFVIVEEMPVFPGGNLQLPRWIAMNIRYPVEAFDNGIKGRVFVSFIVDEKGKVTNIRIIRGVHPLLDEEAVRVVKSMPNWKPGENRGKPVRVSYNTNKF